MAGCPPPLLKNTHRTVRTQTLLGLHVECRYFEAGRNNVLFVCLQQQSVCLKINNKIEIFTRCSL